MTVSLEPVTRDDIAPLIRMGVRDNQSDFVAANSISLAQAAHEPNTTAFVVMANDTRVGLMTVIDTRGYPHLEDGDDPECAFIWRFMIDKAHQGQGLGRLALGALTDWARQKGLKRLYLSVVPTNTAATGLYESVGYARTGRIVHGEVEMRRDL